MRILLAAILWVAFSMSALANMDDTMRGMLRWIGEHSDYDVDVPLPDVKRVTAEDLMILYYGRLPNENEHFLEVEAIYLDDPPPAIWFQDDFSIDDPSWRAALVHELVHHLQFQSGKEFRCTAEMEAEAYKLSDLYAVEVLEDESLKSDPMMVMFLSTCPRW